MNILIGNGDWRNQTNNHPGGQPPVVEPEPEPTAKGSVKKGGMQGEGQE